MDMVFVYEDKIAQDAEGHYYTGSALPQAVFDRYLQHFDHITVLMRKAVIDPCDSKALSRMNRLDTDRIDVVFLPDLNASLRAHFDPRVRAEFKKTILDLLQTDRAVIVRVPSVSGTIAAEYCHKNGIPYLAEAVGCPWDSLWNHSLKGKVMAPIWRENMRRVMRNADYAVYVTSEFLQRRYPTNGKSAAISDVELQPMDDTILERRLEKIQNHSGKFKIGTAGAINIAYKGQRYMIEALAKLKENGNLDYEYHLAGSGDTSELRALAEKRGVSEQVIFDGVLRHDQMFSWFDDLDLYIQPSIVEAMPRALIEAMSRGLPAIGSVVGGIPELLGESCVFPKKDVENITELLEGLTSEAMLSMAERNYEHGKQFEKDLLNQKRYDFYSSFASEVKEKLN